MCLGIRAFEFVVVRYYGVFIVKIPSLRWYILGGEGKILFVPFVVSLQGSLFIWLFSRLISFKLPSDRRNYTCLSVAVLSCQRTDVLLALDRVLRNFKFWEA